LKNCPLPLNLVLRLGDNRLNADLACMSYASSAWQSFQTGNPRIITKPLQPTDAAKDKSKNKGKTDA